MRQALIRFAQSPCLSLRDPEGLINLIRNGLWRLQAANSR
jgi:hypothetical protein